MTILIIILIIIAIPLILAAFASDTYLIERDIVINKPTQDVFNYIRLLKNQDHYSKWVQTDPNSRRTFTGTDGTTGFIFAWDSDNKQAGKGEQEITRIIDGKAVECEIRFEKPMKNVAHSDMKTESVGSNQTKVTWDFKGKRNYMMKVMHVALRLENMLGKDLDISLGKLKAVLEK